MAQQVWLKREIKRCLISAEKESEIEKKNARLDNNAIRCCGLSKIQKITYCMLVAAMFRNRRCN